MPHSFQAANSYNRLPSHPQPYAANQGTIYSSDFRVKQQLTWMQQAVRTQIWRHITQHVQTASYTQQFNACLLTANGQQFKGSHTAVHMFSQQQPHQQLSLEIKQS